MSFFINQKSHHKEESNTIRLLYFCGQVCGRIASGVGGKHDVLIGRNTYNVLDINIYLQNRLPLGSRMSLVQSQYRVPCTIGNVRMLQGDFPLTNDDVCNTFKQ